MLKQKWNIQEKKIKYELQRSIFFVECPSCHREITGISKDTLIRNIEAHLVKCKKKQRKKQRQMGAKK
jgi:hypothetical protein